MTPLTCPSNCSHSSENDFHLLQCTAPILYNAWKSFYSLIDTILEKNHIEPSIRKTLYNIIYKIHPISSPKTSINHTIPSTKTNFSLAPAVFSLNHFFLTGHNSNKKYLKLNSLPSKQNHAQLGKISIGKALFQHVLNFLETPESISSLNR